MTIMQSFKEVFKTKDFLLLWFSQTFSQLADRMLVGVLLLQVHNLTTNKLGLAIPMLSFGISALIFSLIAGVYVDRWKKKMILVVSNLIRIVLISIFIFLPFTTNSLVYLFIVSFLIFTVAQFFLPAETSSIPLLVKKKDLTAANSLFMVTWMGSTVVGFALIPVLAFFQLTLENMYVFTAIFYAIAAIIASLMHFPEYSTCAEHSYQQIIKDLTLGLEFIRRNFIVRITLFNLFVATTVLAILSELAIDFVASIIGIQKTYFGYFIALSGVGMFFGIITINIFNELKRGILISIGFLITGIILIFLSYTNTVIMALVLIFFLGVGNGYITIPIQTTIQAKTPKHVRGRVFGIQNMIVNSAFTIPVVIGGYLANILSTSMVFYSLGILVLIVGLINVIIPKARTL
ncbi:MAG: hypothetical protein A2X42_07875 [Candidatus Margulisbacteria bacterium GWF2_38_17]|nr:MAG: hypothetical protein A2X42_07875 [Candidatus Margulisbacteria bacterium GWF2_38_17]HCY36505.1 hypothetical protein [Candidatus Margulisiibacteriota bacterium]